jgi:signal transduction histidine kinase/CheY-like chemotaxis protein
MQMSNPKAASWFQMEKGKDFISQLESLKDSSVLSEEECSKLVSVALQCMMQNKDDVSSEDFEVTVETLAGNTYSFMGRLCEKIEDDDDNDDDDQVSANGQGGGSGEDDDTPSLEKGAPPSTATTKGGAAAVGAPVDVIGDCHVMWVISDVSHVSGALQAQHNAIVKFMRCTSHEMRTPMQAISLAAHSLSEAVGDSKSDIDTIISSSTILETIMSNILEFKNISAMKFDPVMKAVDVKESLDRIVSILQHSTITLDDVELSADIDWEGTRFIVTDSQMIDRIMLNLVSNALKFTTKGFVKIKASLVKNDQVNVVSGMLASLAIRGSADDADGGGGGDDDVPSNDLLLRIQVIDTGCGMDKAEQAQVGEYDFSDSSGAVKGLYQGFGLGTYIVRNYIQALGGSFTLQSEVGRGTTVSIDIPTRQADEEVEVFKRETSEMRRHSLSPRQDKSSRKSIQQSSKASSLSPPTSDVSAATKDSNNSDTFGNSNKNNNKNNNNNINHSNSNAGNPTTIKKSRSITLKGNEVTDGIVLVVEDIPVNRKLIVKALERGGFKVEQAENGAVALDMMLHRQYRTVFMDVNMPVMNGDEAVKEYWKRSSSERFKMDEDNEQQQATTTTPLVEHPKIIMLTGNITDADRDMALACGAHQFMTKPVVPSQLWEAASWSVRDEESPRSSPRSTTSSQGTDRPSVDFPSSL